MQYHLELRGGASIAVAAARGAGASMHVVATRVGECECVCVCACVRIFFECVPNAYASVNAPAMLTLICYNVI